ncbi:MAG: VIT domain-containing protein [Verrucomicrobiales bacterium]
MKTTATQNNMESTATEYGLYIDEAGTRSVRLPLKAVDARFEVCGDAAEVSIGQIFEFSGPNPVDVIYVFPLPGDASVHRCEMKVGDRVVSAVVKPTEEARRDFAKAKASGHRAALVETVRPNLFELRLGNVQPGDAISIVLSYSQSLAGEGKARRLEIPVCPGVRYIPGHPVGADGGTDLVPDAGRLNPRRIGRNDPDAALFFCVGSLRGAGNITSPSHPMEIGEMRIDGSIPVFLRDHIEVPDQSLVVNWTTTAAPMALVSRTDGSYLLCSVQAPDDMPSARGQRDILFLLDSSGSMEGDNWRALTRAMITVLMDIPSTDRIAVNLFASKLQSITSGFIPATEKNTHEIASALITHRPSGGTEFTNAFGQSIRQAGMANRPVIVVITDGQFGDEARACELAAGCGIEIHTIGIDANVNDDVLRKIARRTRGTCNLCSPDEELQNSMRRLIRNLLSPALDRLDVGEGWTVVGNPPALRGNQGALVPFTRNSGKQDQEIPSHIDLDMHFTDGSQRQARVPVTLTDSRAPMLLAAKAEITSLIDSGKSDEAVAVACRQNILCDGASFIAVDTINMVPVATVIMEQPSMDLGDCSEHPLPSCSPIEPAFSAASMFQFIRKSRPRSFSMSRVESLISRASAPPSDMHLEFGFESSDPADFTRGAAEAITCFDRRKWMELFTKVLLVWGMGSDESGRILDEMLQAMLAAQGMPDSREKCILFLRDFATFFPQAQASAIGTFCDEMEGADDSPV